MIKMLSIVIVLFFSLYTTVQSDCWWSDCQSYSQTERDCGPADKWFHTGATRPCWNGYLFHCCRKDNSFGGDSNNNGGGKNGGNRGGKLEVSWEQFQRAVTVSGYRSPNRNQYNSMINQAANAGGITTTRELAMFLSQILWESGGLQFKKELACLETGCPGVYDSSVGAPGRNYFGRGYIQLSHSYNYKAASLALYNDLRLINNPDMVSDNEDVAWATAFWFWKANVHNANGVQKGWFGSSTNAINGGLECRGAFQDKARKRFEIYKNVLATVGINEAPNERGCYN